MRVMAGDVGGTKTVLQLADYAADGWRVVAHERFDNRAFTDFDAVLAAFLRTAAAPERSVDSVCFAVAGPVRDGSVRLTNLPWSIHAAGLRGRLGVERVGLINDLEGAGYGIDSVDPSRLLILQAGIPEPHGVRALIGAGTGLGEACAVAREGLYEVIAGEGGHVDFAPRDSLESDLLAYLRARLGRVSVEHVLSGAGLKRVFDYLLLRSRTELLPALEREFGTADAAAVICQHALARDDATAAAAVECYIRIYAAQAANLALTVGARGGVYVVGGIAAKISAALGTGGFLAAFLDHPAMAAWLRRIPLCVVLDEDVVVMGARAYALRHA